MTDRNRILVIGIGNDFRSDDAVGLYVVRKIEEMGLEGVTIIKGINDGTSMIELWAGVSNVFVIDCVSSGDNPGKVYRFDAFRNKIPEDRFPSYSSHAFNITDTIALARNIDRLPGSLIIYGIEGENFDTGDRLSNAVKESAGKAVIRLAGEIERIICSKCTD